MPSDWCSGLYSAIQAQTAGNMKKGRMICFMQSFFLVVYFLVIYFLVISGIASLSSWRFPVSSLSRK